ncbi:hypothetical protein K1719_001296 [Acacia pycnantha]|nr:hypothetical protein K1719_001296 [Acacia pycnantha]
MGDGVEDDPFNGSLATIEAATNKFTEENKIGKGGFGYVYKGTLFDGREIAVKRLLRKEREKILIYEYVPNKSIDFFLFDSEKQRLFNWFEQFKIIGGIA